MKVVLPTELWRVWVPGNFPVTFYEERHALARCAELRRSGHKVVNMAHARVGKWDERTFDEAL